MPGRFSAEKQGEKRPNGIISARSGYPIRPLFTPCQENALANPLQWLLGLITLDISIDLGTANTLVNVHGKGIVINEPSWVAIDKKTRRVLKVGRAAKEIVGRTPPNVVTLRPIRDGVISEFDAASTMMEYFIRRVINQSVVPVPLTRVIVGVPVGATSVERRAVVDAAVSAGAREALLVEEPMASAIGAGLPIRGVHSTMLMDIGGGTTEIAVFSSRRILLSHSIRVAGDEMDDNVTAYLRDKYNLLVGQTMAEQAKKTVGAAAPLGEEKVMTVRGRNLISGLPEEVEISSVEMREALAPSLKTISQALRDTLEQAPPEIMADLLDSGLCLTGGGSLLNGLPERLSEEFRIRVWRADDPLTCVVRGAAAILASHNEHREFLASTDKDQRTRK
jgi:rod shape-determining protein MreB